MVNIGSKKITHIYQGDELLSTDDKETKTISIGNNPIPFVYQGNQLLYPNPIKDELVLWYDFKDMKNIDVSKSVIQDLSGLNNNGTLQNFTYTNDSGYNDGLKFDGVDDNTLFNVNIGANFSIFITLKSLDIVGSNQYILGSSNVYNYIRNNNRSLDFAILNTLGKQEIFKLPNFFSGLIDTKISIGYVFDSDNKKVYMYYNGELFETFNMLEKISNNTNLNKIGMWQNGYYFKGVLYSFQVYNTKLNNEEIQHNYQIEKERWGL